VPVGPNSAHHQSQMPSSNQHITSAYTRSQMILNPLLITIELANNARASLQVTLIVKYLTMPTVAKSGPDPRRCSASVGGPTAPEAATARGGLHRPGGSACGLLCIAHRLRADPCRGSRRRRRDLRLGRTSVGAVGGGGGICVSGEGG
jgi:hypothetical protein